MLMTQLYSSVKFNKYSNLLECIHVHISQYMSVAVLVWFDLNKARRTSAEVEQRRSSNVNGNVFGPKQMPLDTSSIMQTSAVMYIWLLWTCMDDCVSDGGAWLICPRACLLLLNSDYLLFKSQLTAPAGWPGLYLQRPHLALNQYRSSGERNGWSEGGSNRWGSLILLDIYLGCALSTIKQNLGQVPQPWIVAASLQHFTALILALVTLWICIFISLLMMIMLWWCIRTLQKMCYYGNTF